ncbi:MAG: glutamine synthetase [Candidatus Gastranaerophilaceae bacterium]
MPTTGTHDSAGYYDVGPDDKGEDIRAQIVDTLEQLGFEIEASHHEVARGQHEVDFKYADALTAADNIVTFKYAVKASADRFGLHATFMPKPIYGINGSGMHCNISLFDIKKGKNAFFNEDSAFQLSKEALYTIGAILENVKDFTAITNPTVNSYKRLVPGYEAPVYIAWSLANRSALIRVPAKRGNATRVELRSPDASCNPYLVMAVLLTVAMEGIKNQIKPPLQTEENIYDMTAKERKRNHIDSLPGSLNEALALMKKSKLVKKALGEHIFNEFVMAKEMEWDRYRTDVSPWELNEYLEKY